MPPHRPPFFYRETEAIRVTVRPHYQADESVPHAGRYVFTYAVRIENVGLQAAQLLTRRWLIHDSVGDDIEVEGEGVVGQQPLIHPGGVHEYTSFAVLKTPRGHMVGTYHFIRADGTPLDVAIPRFELEADVGFDVGDAGFDQG